MMDLTEITKHWSQIVSLFGGLYACWRYVASPALKVSRKIQNTSEELSKALPVLLQLAKRYSSDDGELNLPEKIQELQHSVTISHELLKALGNKLNIAWYQTDINGDCLYISNELSKFMGLTLEQAKGSGWKNAIQESDRVRVAEEWRTSVKEQREFDLNYSYHQFSNKKDIPIHCHSYKILNEEGKIIGFIGIVTEIKENSTELGSVH